MPEISWIFQLVLWLNVGLQWKFNLKDNSIIMFNKDWFRNKISCKISCKMKTFRWSIEWTLIDDTQWTQWCDNKLAEVFVKFNN